MSNLIYKKMSQVMAEIKSVGKDQKNIQQGFKFRGIDQFVNALYPALVKNGVFISPRCVKETHELRDVVRSNGKQGADKHVSILMEYDFFAEDGSKVTIGPIPAEGLDSGDKATNKALSAALKYALIQTFSVPTEDMAEADSDSPEITVPTKTATVQAKTAPEPAKVETVQAKANGVSTSFRRPAANGATTSKEF
jgi:ERF superfamily